MRKVEEYSSSSRDKAKDLRLYLDTLFRHRISQRMQVPSESEERKVYGAWLYIGGNSTMSKIDKIKICNVIIVETMGIIYKIFEFQYRAWGKFTRRL